MSSPRGALEMWYVRGKTDRVRMADGGEVDQDFKSDERIYISMDTSVLTVFGPWVSLEGLNIQ